jgi:NCAIR mutase (PurE)-related protein
METNSSNNYQNYQSAYQAVGDFAKIDHCRQIRTGFPEVIFGQGKTPEQIERIIKAMCSNHPVVIATRVSDDVYSYLSDRIAGLDYYPMARICAVARRIIPQPGTIGILCAGTADLPVAEEASVIAELMGYRVDRLWDVGVAGIHRLLSHQAQIAEADVLIVVAGMEGALPSVVAGLSDCPIVAVPTSIGYGAHFGGLAPLLTMLNSCAAGIGVVNIDNGFGAAILAAQILRTAHRLVKRIPQ